MQALIPLRINSRKSIYGIKNFVGNWESIDFLKKMNFLVLSPKVTDFISGNIAADFLKGSDRTFISKGVQTGISMHRFVDQFADIHALVKTSKNRVKNHFRLFSYRQPSGMFVSHCGI